MKPKNIFWIAFSLAAYAIIIWYFGGLGLLRAIGLVPIWKIVLAALLIQLSLVFEFIKWQYYLSKLKIKLPWKRSLLIFLAGNAFAFLPAKSGEIVRSSLMKRHGISYRKTLPLYFAVNFTLLLGILMLTFPILIFLGYKSLYFISLVVLFMLAISFHFSFYGDIVRWINKKLKTKYLEILADSITYSRSILGPKDVAIAAGCTLLYAFCVFLGFALLSSSFDLPVSPLFAYSIYNLTLVVGIISMLPGGVGITESTYIVLLSQFMPAEGAAAMILLMRFVALWLPMFVGMACMNAELGQKAPEDYFSA